MSKAAAVTTEDASRIAERRFAAEAINTRSNKTKLGHPRNVIKKFLALCSQASSGEHKDDLHSQIEAFIAEELAHLKLALDSKDLEIEVAAQGMRHLQQRQSELQGQVQTVEAEIVASQQALEESKVFKQHQDEYELLRQKVMQYPPRAQTEAEIAQVKAGTEELLKEGAQLDRDIELRRKQFAHLNMVLQDLYASVREPAPSEDNAGNQMDVD